MASTSLAEQLKRLSAPQSSIYREDKKKASLLFDPKEAALKDRDTFYEIGLSGLHELIELYVGFRVYEDSLFSVSSKDFERALQSKEINKNLDSTIEKFLLELSPYFLLQSSHKALEWLVNRYQIHQYNQNEIMALILPYHGSKIFVRFIQIMDIKDSSNRWNWIQPIQKHGVPLANQVWYNQCVSNSASLQFVAKVTVKYVKVFGERSSQLNTVFAFFCQTALGVLESSKHVSEGTINALLPTLVKGIDSPILDFRSSAFIIIGFLLTKTSIKTDTLNEIINKLFTTEFNMTYDMAILITMTYYHQPHLTSLSDSILYNLSSDVMTTFCSFLKKSVENKQNIQPFILAFLSSILPLIWSDIEEFRRFYRLPEILIDEVDLRNQQPETVIECIISTFKLQGNNENANNDESDIETIDVDDSSSKILMWYSSLLKSLEIKYPNAFDKVIKQEMSSQNKDSRNRSQLAKVLGFKPAVAHKVGDSCLFENLNHINPELRVEAVKYIRREFKTLKKENMDFVKDSIVDRLNDDNVHVVSAALELPDDYMKEILNEIDITMVFVNIITRKSKKWLPIIQATIEKFCCIETLPVNHETILALVPYLFPYDKTSTNIAWSVINSPWGHKFQLTRKIKKKLEGMQKNHHALSDAIFTELFINRNIHFDDILDINLINKNNTLDVYTYLLLKSCSFESTTTDGLVEALDMVLESVEVEHRVIVASSENESFSKKVVSEYIKLAPQNKILFEVVEYILSRIIESTNFTNVSKPWCNFCESSETTLVRRLYEICISGCSIPTYEMNYVKLLQQLLTTFCVNFRERCEFIVNFACGHILYATDPKDVIGPELQIRSMKLLSNCMSLQNSDWQFESDVILLMVLFNLNNPMALIRECTLELMHNLIKTESDLKNIYFQLMKYIMDHRQEILMDHEQIKSVLNIIFSQTSPTKKIFRKNCMMKFTNIITSDTPSYVVSNFVKLLVNISNANTFPSIILSLKPLERKLLDNHTNLKIVYDIYESNLFKNVYSLINENTAVSFSKDIVWDSVEFGLKEYKECILHEATTFTSPCVLLLKFFDEDVFKKVPDEKIKCLVRLITSAGTFSNNPTISSAAAKVIRKINLKQNDFISILNEMLAAVDPAANVMKKKKVTSLLSYQVTETNEWRLGVTLLEYLQNKKKLCVDNTFVSLLFELLSKCLRFEEQSYVEYVKQLLLSSLWYYCKRFVNDKDEDQIKSLQTHFKIDLVVQCIRGTQNPQTHHHALILLSHAAYMLPEQVLQNTMDIFTFMGSSVLRHDDAYSFQIIIKIIETLIPILVKLDQNIEEYTQKQLQQLQARVVPVLRIFADVVLHVPEHRRLPLYKKLIETLGANNFLWVFLALVLETHVSHFNDDKKKDKGPNRTLADQESPDRLDFAQSILLEFPPEICLQNLILLMDYVKSLPVQKDENSMDSDIDPSDIFSVCGHSAVQLRQYKYVIITFMSNCLASSQFIQHCNQATTVKVMESHYKTYIINTLTFIQSITKLGDEKNAKYWRVMLHHSYDLLDHINNLLSASMFLSVVRGLLSHTLHAVRRKSMELLNSKIQFSPEMFNDVDKSLMCSLLPPLLDIIRTIENMDENMAEATAQEMELNQQTALLSLKLLTRMLASEHPEPFKPVLETVTEYTGNPKISENVMASVVLCLAEFCSNLKVHALSSLRKFMPALLKVLKKQRKSETPELILLSTVTAISKIVESLPLFLSPYLEKILYEYAILTAKWQTCDPNCNKVSAIITKLLNIKKKIAVSIAPRVLIPVSSTTYQLLLEKENFDAIGPVMSVLAECFVNITTADFNALQQDLTAFFLSALQLRSDAAESSIDYSVIDSAEDEVVNALVRLVFEAFGNQFPTILL
ncbi:hypothetical protein ACJJTC_001381 [Scirpophaga incertulas]